MKYRLIINGKLQDKVLNNLDEVIKELNELNQLIVYSVNWVIA